MLKSSEIINDLNCPLMETSVLFDAATRGKAWIIKSISLSKNGFRIYSSDEEGPVLVRSFTGDYQIFGNYIQPSNECPLQIISSFNELFTLETFVECKNSNAQKGCLFSHLNPNLYLT
jgi:hypothetical protein